jgi:hypothetical protein
VKIITGDPGVFQIEKTYRDYVTREGLQRLNAIDRTIENATDRLAVRWRSMYENHVRKPRLIAVLDAAQSSSESQSRRTFSAQLR